MDERRRIKLSGMSQPPAPPSHSHDKQASAKAGKSGRKLDRPMAALAGVSPQPTTRKASPKAILRAAKPAITPKATSSFRHSAALQFGCWVSKISIAARPCA